ncbi:GNAT family N-acetyltransferase [Streptomyces galbus]|uniref:GNAT family N-acetyltransferase n=1 Tax=Streptomyces galbus TaxID=33898 RepID=A0A4U5X3A7_STRGB|nr:GNAT family N-acetyltransferase [Streptomyces galbus]TKT09507.1 GNAT family N-acetyltransferase [Streptomyces galbus]GHD28014.1 histone acetyltransferase [Streptomyces galbus]
MRTDSPVVIRRATAADALALADVYLRSFGAALPTVVRPRTDAEVRAYIRDIVVPHRDTWVAVHTGDRGGTGGSGHADDGSGSGSGEVVGLMVLDGESLSQLYLAPEWRGRGIGDRFVSLARQRSPHGLSLWTFQVNKPAHRFYERHGFTAVEFTDGSGNEEQEPDVRYVWRP